MVLNQKNEELQRKRNETEAIKENLANTISNRDMASTQT